MSVESWSASQVNATEFLKGTHVLLALEGLAPALKRALEEQALALEQVLELVEEPVEWVLVRTGQLVVLESELA